MAATRGNNQRLAGQGVHFNKSHGTAEFDDANADAPVYAVEERIFKKD